MNLTVIDENTVPGMRNFQNDGFDLSPGAGVVVRLSNEHCLDLIVMYMLLGNSKNRDFESVVQLFQVPQPNVT